MIGDSAVGKSTLLTRYIKGDEPLPKHVPPTIGVEFKSKNMKMDDGSTVKA
jgi:GTPase SAR1 family protein